MPFKLNPITGDLDMVMRPGEGVAIIQIDTDSGSAVATDLGALTLAGGTGVITSATGNTATISLEPMTDGQLFIGSTAGTSPIASTLTPGTGVTIVNGSGSILISAAGGVAMSFAADTGTAAPSLNIINMAGDATQGLITSATGSTVTYTISDASSTQKGVQENATGSEAVSASSNTLTLTPGVLGAVFSSPPALGGTIPNTGKFTTITMSGQLTNTLADGTTPFVITSTTVVSNLNSDQVDGYDASDMNYTFVSGNDISTDVTGAELETLSDGSDAGSLHIHDARYYTETELGATTSGASGCTLIGSPSIGTPTYTTVFDRLNFFSSAGRATGGLVTDAGGENLNVSAGTGFIKATDSDVAEILSFDWIANAALATTTDTHQHVGIIYDGGTPIVDIRATNNYDLDTEFPLASIVNEGGTLHILNNFWWVTDGITNIIERFRADGFIIRDNTVGGLILTVPGTRNLSVTAGRLWSNLNEFVIPSIDTSIAKVASHSAVFDVDNGSGKGTITASAGTPYTVLTEGEYVAITGTGDNDGTYKIESIVGGNVLTMYTVIAGTDGTEATTVITRTFELYSYDGVAGTWSDSHETQYPVTLWNDTTLAALQVIPNNKFANLWLYAEADDKMISMVYGQAVFVSAAGAEAEAPPTLLPSHIQEHAIFIGRILIKQAVDAPVQVDTAWETTFSSSQSSDHGNLAGLADDDHVQYVLADGTRTMTSLTLTNALTVPNGGTGVQTATDGGLLLGSGVGALTSLAQATDGQIPIGSTGADCVLNTITAGAGIGITNAAGSITITNIAGGFTWTVVTDATQALAIQNGYIGNRGTAITYTLPDTAAVGSTIQITNIGAGLPVIAQNAGESIHFAASTTTVGVGGSLTGIDQYCSIELLCVVADTEWIVLDSVGSFTIV